VSFLKKARHVLEVLGFYFFFYGMRSLPLDWASAAGGALGRFVRPFFKADRLALKNLAQAFPGLSEEENKRLRIAMWDGFGRLGAEYAHPEALRDSFPQDRIEIQGGEILETLKKNKSPLLFVGAHLSNLQIVTLAAARCGVAICQFYRPPNNPLIRSFVEKIQQPFVAETLPKDSHSLKNLLQTVKRGANLLIFFDQHMDKGTPVPFFGRPALTAPTTVRLAQKFKAPLVPFRVERLGGAFFRVTFYPPLDLEREEGEILTEMNHLLEGWIRERPEQWFWVHNRWKGITSS